MEIALKSQERSEPTKIDSPFTDKEHFLKSCLDLQIEAKMKLNYWETKVARLLYGPYEKAYNVSVKAVDMKKTLRSACTTAIEQLRTKLRGKMFCLKLEAFADKSYLGVSVQFMENFQVKVAHLGRMHFEPECEREEGCEDCLMDGRQRPDYGSFYSNPGYAEELESLLQVAGLGGDQIYSTTLDCVSNNEWWFDKFEEYIPNYSFSEPAVKVLNFGFSDWLQPYRRDFPTLLDKRGFGPVFRKLGELKEKECDGSTKWSPEESTLVQKLWRAMQPFQDLMESVIKSKDYTCGDLMSALIACDSELQQHNDEISTALFEQMKIRKEFFLQNIEFQAALYLDPEFNNCNSEMLNKEQKSNVVTHLLRVFERIRYVSEDATGEEDYRDSGSSESDDGEEEDESDCSESGDGEEEEEEESDDEEDYFTTADLKKMLEEMESQAEPEPNSEFELIEYWQAQSHPQLKRLANVVLAQPVSKIPIRSNFDFDSKMLTSNKGEDLQNLMKMHIGYTTDM